MMSVLNFQNFRVLGFKITKFLGFALIFKIGLPRHFDKVNLKHVQSFKIYCFRVKCLKMSRFYIQFFKMSVCWFNECYVSICVSLLKRPSSSP